MDGFKNVWAYIYGQSFCFAAKHFQCQSIVLSSKTKWLTTMSTCISQENMLVDIVASHPVLEDTGMVIGNRGGEVGCIEFALF